MSQGPKRKLKAGRFAALAGEFWRDCQRHCLSHSAQALYCAGLSYAAEQRTDGEVPRFMLPALFGGNASGIANGAHEAAARELLDNGWWQETPNGFLAVGWAKYNPTRAEIEAHSKKQSAIAAKRWNATGIPGGNPPPTPNPQVSPSEKQRSVEPPSGDSPPVDLGQEIAVLEARYPSGLCAEAREACALSRRHGKLSDSVWLKFLRQLEAHPADRVAEGMRTFAERYADGEKDERYLLGIVRNGSKRPANRNGRGPARPATHEEFAASWDPARDDVDKIDWGAPKESANA